MSRTNGQVCFDYYQLHHSFESDLMKNSLKQDILRC